MESGFGFWLLVMLLGVLALGTPPNKILVVLHSYGTSFGFMHYVAQDARKFCFVAHCSILFEVIMGIVVGIKLLEMQATSGVVFLGSEPSVSTRPDYVQVPTEERMSGLEMQQRGGLRQRSRSPKVTFQQSH